MNHHMDNSIVARRLVSLVLRGRLDGVAFAEWVRLGSEQGREPPDFVRLVAADALAVLATPAQVAGAFIAGAEEFGRLAREASGRDEADR